MIQCKSCGSPIPLRDQIKTLPDGTKYQEDMCISCITIYVDLVDFLPYKEYAFEDLTERTYQEIVDFDQEVH